MLIPERWGALGPGPRARLPASGARATNQPPPGRSLSHVAAPKPCGIGPPLRPRLPPLSSSLLVRKPLALLFRQHTMLVPTSGPLHLLLPSSHAWLLMYPVSPAGSPPQSPLPATPPKKPSPPARLFARHVSLSSSRVSLSKIISLINLRVAGLPHRNVSSNTADAVPFAAISQNRKQLPVHKRRSINIH